jgi:hypothetical protein
MKLSYFLFLIYLICYFNVQFEAILLSIYFSRELHGALEMNFHKQKKSTGK